MAEPTSPAAVVTTENGATVTVLVEPAPADPERIADMGALWSIFLVAAVVVFCARRLLDLFRVNQDD